MLRLRRRAGDEILIGDKIRIKVLETGSAVVLGIEAPRDVLILRAEIADADVFVGQQREGESVK